MNETYETKVLIIAVSARMVSPHTSDFSGWCCAGWYAPSPSPLMHTSYVGQVLYPSWKRPAEQVIHNEALPCYKL